MCKILLALSLLIFMSCKSLKTPNSSELKEVNFTCVEDSVLPYFCPKLPSIRKGFSYDDRIERRYGGVNAVSTVIMNTIGHGLSAAIDDFDNNYRDRIAFLCSTYGPTVFDKLACVSGAVNGTLENSPLYANDSNHTGARSWCRDNVWGVHEVIHKMGIVGSDKEILSSKFISSGGHVMNLVMISGDQEYMFDTSFSSPQMKYQDFFPKLAE